MNKKRTITTFRNRYLGVIVLVVIQLIVGFIHIFFGVSMFVDNFFIANITTPPTTYYSMYTLFYGILTFVFTYLFWTGRRSGWIGIILVSLFVIAADTLTFFNFLTILGIPKIAVIGEIPFSILIVVYLFQNHVRSKYVA